MLRRSVAIALAAPWIAWAVVRTLGLDGSHQVIEAMTYTPYVAASSPLPVLAGLALRRWIVAAVAGVAALALLLAIVPRAVGGSGPAPTGPKLVVMTLNLYVGRADAPAVVELVRRHHVDVLSVEELTPEGLGRLDAAGLARLLPGRDAEPRDGASGSALLTRRPLVRLPTLAAGDHVEPQIRLSIPGAPPLWIESVHPAPPLNGARAALWQRSLRALAGADGRGDVQLLAGDFNATLDHRELRRVLDRGYADAAERAGAGLRATWPALPRRSLPITIDHVLVDRRVRVDAVHVEQVPQTDHRAVIAELTLPAG